MEPCNSPTRLGRGTGLWASTRQRWWRIISCSTAARSAPSRGAVTLNPYRGILLDGTTNHTTGGVIDASSGGVFTIPGVIADGANGSASLTKTGVGQLILAGSNTYSGGTIVNAGTLTAANSNALGSVAGGILVRNNSTFSLDNTLPGGAIIIGAEALTLSSSASSMSPVRTPLVEPSRSTPPSATTPPSSRPPVS